MFPQGYTIIILYYIYLRPTLEVLLKIHWCTAPYHLIQIFERFAKIKITRKPGEMSRRCSFHRIFGTHKHRPSGLTAPELWSSKIIELVYQLASLNSILSICLSNIRVWYQDQNDVILIMFLIITVVQTYPPPSIKHW